MKKHITSRTLSVLVPVLFLIGCSTAVLAQGDATRRLYNAIDGFALNEGAAKSALAAGGDINWHNPAMAGETILIMAIKGFKESNVIKFLVDNGANVSLKDDSGKTALDWARQYNFDRNRNGRDIIAMLEAAAGQRTGPAQPAEELPTNTTGPAGNGVRRTGGAPSDQEIKETLEKSLTNAYQNHFFGVKNKVTFEWSGGITVGAPETRGRIPTKCFPAKLNVKVTMEDPRDGNRSTLTRGIDAKIGGFAKSEIFCFSKNGFGSWEYTPYEP